ncbi:pantetheine-phosphate adenylyltransferase [Calorimonas adulescens]|uniref:Phosphopantetheine adenylyltransferase n=1 Tax=Calorimonas adulescens TaxID=2606906 RepID=A0A5D8QJD9_9THEO|nr:pantetheine-phosphate adenylyltransferase [Calorimonas adulescens]TZE83398.1 pantetheine-phosphate adenylyltransferase [Calorimonas adulescens]
MKIAVYPGSFDPITFGHLDIIERSSSIFDRLIVTILENSSKKPLFSVEERKDMIIKTTSAFKNVEVDYFSGLLMDYMRQNNYHIIIKGLRMLSDFEYEFQMALMNKKLNDDVETLFMMTSSKYAYLSSSIVKEVASFGGDIDDLVPAYVASKLKSKLEGR